MTMRDNTVVDINCNEVDDFCIICLGTEILEDGSECACVADDEYFDNIPRYEWADQHTIDE